MARYFRGEGERALSRNGPRARFPAHSPRRATAMQLAREEHADPMIVLPAAYLHDFVGVPKDDPRRAQASALSAEAASNI